MTATRALVGIALHCWLTAPVLAAGLTVIVDSGNTQPLAPFLEVFDGGPDADVGEVQQERSLGVGDLQNLLPIHSAALSPGTVQRRAAERPFSGPMFLLGADPRSERWLLRHRARLKRLGAVGLLVEVPDVATLRRLATLAAGLTLLPASGDDLAARLGLTHYPVLITQDGIEQ